MIRLYPSSSTYISQPPPPPPCRERVYVSTWSRKNISDWLSGRLPCWCTDIMIFQNPMYMASRQLMIPRIAAAGTSFSPLPCQARHGYRVANAHMMEVKVGADGHASAPPSMANAATPPAGAHCHNLVVLGGRENGVLASRKFMSFFT
jgi:hypothetical protein